MICIRHTWVEQARTYAPARAQFRGEGIPKDVFERAVHGVTTILQECSRCRKQRTVQMLGAVVKP